MKLPRDISGPQLAATLGSLGYEVTRQSGSHMRLTTAQGGEHHVTVPRHDIVRTGTLGAILADVARHFQLSKEALIEQLFGKR
jgi:predicted RNA binding protein YcfA (HicA-like mRNA interferase family)